MTFICIYCSRLIKRDDGKIQIICDECRKAGRNEYTEHGFRKVRDGYKDGVSQY